MTLTLWRTYLEESGDGAFGVMAHASHVLKQPEQWSIGRVETPKRHQDTIELEEQTTPLACSTDRIHH